MTFDTEMSTDCTHKSNLTCIDVDKELKLIKYI